MIYLSQNFHKISFLISTSTLKNVNLRIGQLSQWLRQSSIAVYPPFPLLFIQSVPYYWINGRFYCLVFFSQIEP